MRTRISLLILLAAVAGTAAAQDVQLQGRFLPLRAPDADARPPVGEVRARIEEDGDVRIDLVVSGLGERVTSATLHTGTGGESTGQVARMDVVADGNEARIIGARVDLTPLVAQQVRSGAAFVVLRTSEHPDGVLRASLAPQARTLGSIAPPGGG